MPDAIRIDSLPVLQSEEPRDLINFQRLVDGTWQDFHTDLGTFYGELRTFVHTYELDTFDTQVVVYSPEADELAVPIGLIVKYTPGDNPTDQSQQISFDTELNAAVNATFTNGSSPLVIQPVDVGAFGGLDTDLLLNLSSGGGNGTAVCIATYAVLQNINAPINAAVVEEAGTSAADGTYVFDPLAPIGGSSAFPGSDRYFLNVGDGYTLLRLDGTGAWAIFSVNADEAIYTEVDPSTGYGTHQYPWEVTAWENSGPGDAPAPTVRQAFPEDL